MGDRAGRSAAVSGLVVSLALQDLTEAERLYEAARTARKVQLSDADRARVLALARNLPRVWNAPSTTDADRKSLLRTLVLGVTLTPVDVPRRQTRIQILWEGGAVTEIRAERPRCGPSATPSTTLEARIRCLVEQGTSDHEIARILNAEGHRTPAGAPWTHGSTRRTRRRLELRQDKGAAPYRHNGLHSTRGVADVFGVSTSTVTNWTRWGWIEPVEPGARGKSAWYRLDNATIKRIDERRRQGRTARRLPEEAE